MGYAASGRICMHHARRESAGATGLCGRKRADLHFAKRPAKSQRLADAGDLLWFELDSALGVPTQAFAPRLLANLNVRTAACLA